MKSNTISRRRFLQIAGTGVAGGLIAACGAATPTAAPAEQPAEKPAEGEAAEAPAAAPAAAAGSKEYVMWGLEYDPHVDRYKALDAAFSEKTGYKANIQPQAWPLDAKVLAAIAADNQPDVVCIMGIASLPLFQQGAVLQMDEVVYKEAGVNVTEFFYPEALQAYTWEGHYYGVPLESNQVSTVVGTRYDYLDEVGDSAKALWPGLQGKDQFASFEDMWALAELLQKKEGDTITRWGMSGQGWDLGQFFSIMRSCGKFFWDAEQKKFNFDSEEAVKAAQLYIETPVKKGIETQLDDHHMNMLFAGKIGVGMGNTAMAPEGAKLGLTVETVTTPPAIPGQKALFVGEGGWGWEIPARAKNMAAAVEFCKWMSTREGQVIYAQIYGGCVSSTPTVFDDAIYQGDDLVKKSKRRAIATLPDTVYYGNDWGLNRTGAGEILEELRQGATSAEEACAKMQETMTTNYQQWKDSLEA